MKVFSQWACCMGQNIAKGLSSMKLFCWHSDLEQVDKSLWAFVSLTLNTKFFHLCSSYDVVSFRGSKTHENICSLAVKVYVSTII